jgi:murein DD-endopeptidase MepM/ murein hydrolase activator NlpD
MWAVALVSLVVSQAPSEPSLSAGRHFAKELAAGHVEAVWSAKSARVPQTPAAKRKVAKLAEQIRGFGPETRLISEGLTPLGDRWVYRRVAAVEYYARGFEVTLSLDERGRLIEGTVGGATSAAPTTHDAYRAKNHFTSPVEGQWAVLWGGRTWEDNRHASVPDMRYALDLLIRGADGRSNRDKGLRNDDYYAWNQPVLAAADGVVVAAQDGLPDTPPNRPRLGSLYGNLVVIDHGHGEFSLYGHLREGSVRVKVGDVVAAGDRLARTGSSGMSTEPHLHFQVMDHADYRVAEGLPVPLDALQVNGRVSERVELRRGDVFGPRPVEARRGE